MFHSADFTPFLESTVPRVVSVTFFGNGVDDGLSFHIDALNLVSMVVWCRIESHCQIQTSVQSLPKGEKLPFSVFCFNMGVMFICLIVSLVLPPLFSVG